ncbi:histidinol-phosphate transaminase [PVC group bacterium]|nr:histidinol-phosphate transaminase [PVC group bacterium]
MLKRLMNKNFLNFKPYEPGKPIDEVSRELKIRNIIKLASNENPFGPSPKAVQAAKRALLSSHVYPDGSCYHLQKKLASKLGVKPGNIIFGNGSNELVELIMSVFVGKNENIIISRHAFVVYRLCAKQKNIKFIEAPMLNYTHDLKFMAKAVTKKTKLIFVANPNNPTGTINTAGELDQFIQSLPGDVILVVDEAYCEFVQSKQYPKTLRYIRSRKNIILLRTFSKIYGLAGLRIGYAIGSERLVKPLHLARQPFNVNSIAQIAASAAIDDNAFVRKTLLNNKTQMDYLVCELEKLDLKVIPSQANFILINVRQNGRRVFKRLMSRGVIVRPMDEYGFSNMIRVTVGLVNQNKKFIRALKQVLKDCTDRKGRLL